MLTGPDESDRRREAASETVRLRAEETEMQRLLRDGSLTKAEEALNRLPPPQAEGQRPRLDYGAESVAAGCPIAVG